MDIHFENLHAVPAELPLGMHASLFHISENFLAGVINTVKLHLLHGE